MRQDANTIIRLVGELKHKDPGRRADAAWELGEIGAPEAVRSLCQALKDANAWDITREMVQDAVTAALVKIGAPSVLPLCELLQEGNAGIRDRAADALGQIGDPRAVQPLYEALSDRRLWNSRYKAGEALGKIGPAAVEPLCEALQDPRPGVRCVATATLGKIGDPRAIRALCAALWDEHWPVRSLAAAALANIGDCDAIPPLCAALAPGHPERDGHATASLYRRRDPVMPMLAARREDGAVCRASAVEALSQLIRREPAEEVLVQLGAAAVLPLCEVLQREEPEACFQAARVLGRIAEQEPAPELRAAVPALRRLSARRRGWQDVETQIYRSTLERIEAATAAMDLPLPATAPAPATVLLPIPAEPSVVEVENLPIPAVTPASASGGAEGSVGREQRHREGTPGLQFEWVTRILHWWQRRDSHEQRVRE
jgi:HEAT repeat protein